MKCRWSMGLIVIFLTIIVGCNMSLVTEDLGIEDVSTETLGVGDVSSSTVVNRVLSYSGDSPDYGLYWYGGQGECQKYESGQDNAYYDASKPVVIFFHGWSEDMVPDGNEWGFYWDDANSWVDEGWYDKGYNVGIYHWETWADDSDVLYAESKIWSRTGTKGFRYRLASGEYSTENLPSGNGVGVLAYDDIVDCLSDHSSNEEIRFVGHSLGAQLATCVAGLMYYDIEDGVLDEATYKVQRLALLDPAWTEDGKDWWLGDTDLDNDGDDDWVGERSRWIIYDMMDYWDDFAVEIYNTTALSESLGLAMDSNSNLRDTVGSTDVAPWYYSAWELASKHNAAFYNYMWSMEFDAPTECTINWWNRRKSTGNDAPSAAASNSRIVECMASDYDWTQVEGRYSYSPDDDWFERKDR